MLSSTDEVVELELSVVRDPGSDDQDCDEVNFETSRAVLVSAAQAIRVFQDDEASRLDEEWDR